MFGSKIYERKENQITVFISKNDKLPIIIYIVAIVIKIFKKY